MWELSDRADPVSRVVADRHYNRQSIGAACFMPPGRALVLRVGDPALAVWGTSWPFAEYTRHAWAGAWVNSIFRNEGAGLSSALIRDAVAVTRWYYGDPPELGLITFVNRAEVTQRKGRGGFGWCYRKAGFVEVGETQGGLLALQLLPAAMPAPEAPYSSQQRLWGEA